MVLKKNWTTRFIALFFCGLNVLLAQNTNQYSQAKIYIDRNKDIQTLLANGVTADNGFIKQNTYVESVFSDKEIETAKTLGYEVEIVIADWQKHYQEVIKKKSYTKNPAPCGESTTDYTIPAHFNLGSMGGFLTYDQIITELDEMRSVYPNLITVKSPIHTYTTYENRPIYWLKISDNPDNDEPESEMLYTALHHAREPGSMQQLLFYMWYLLENYNTNNEIKNLIDNSEIYFIPVVNPDGYQYNCTQNPSGGGMWRKNRRLNADGSYGVDNNRNYSYHWGESGTSNVPSSDTYLGTAPFSEIENQAIKWFVEQHQFKIAINNHTYSNLLLYPYGYLENVYTPDDALFQEISSVMVAENHFNNIVSWQLYPAAGDSDDWMYAETSTHNKIFAMTPEIGNSFWIAESEIIPQCKDMVHLNLSALRFIHNYPNISDTSANSLSVLNNTFTYQLKNVTVTSNPANYTVTMVPISSNIQSVGAAQNHNNLAAMTSVNGSIDFVLNNTIAQGEEVVFKVLINNGIFTIEKTFTKTYGNFTTLFTDNTNSLSNWQSSSGWNVTTSTYYSAPNCITDSPSGNYQNYINKTITLNNTINLTSVAKAKVQFYAKWNIEPNYDYVQFEISTDNGVTWQPQCGLYTNAGVADQNAENEPLYDGSQTNWVLEEISLNNYVGQNLKARFQIVSDGGVTEDGFYFDNFEVKIIPENVAATDDVLFNSIAIFPNPTDKSFVISNVNIKNTDIEIFNANGQKIMTLRNYQSGQAVEVGKLSAGIYSIVVKNDKFYKTLQLIVE